MSVDHPLRFSDSPSVPIPHGLELILASSSPRRHLLLTAAGYRFRVSQPAETAECGICRGETPTELVARLCLQKAADVAKRTGRGLVLGADTVAECVGQILGKPVDREQAHQMLTLLSGRVHSVFTGVCLWSRPDNQMLVDVTRTQLRMKPIAAEELESYLDGGLWKGKAGAFGYQDGNNWLNVEDGSESNVVGLPIERLGELFSQFTQLAETADPANVEFPS